MKTGVITFHSAHHYGAQLQAYALMKAVMRTGMDCEIINYVRQDNVDAKRLFKKPSSLRNMVSNVHTVLNYQALKKRQQRFESFVNENMALSKKFYGTYEELIKDCPEYDAYICGSDQVWNPLIFNEKTFDPAFFADFAKHGSRIAYAPSFGINDIPENNREQLKEFLSKFEALSVREKQGEKIIADISGRASITVLDPTLLLSYEEWSSIAAKPDIKHPYILCYFISDPSKYSGFVNAIADKLKLPIVSLCGARKVVSNTSDVVLDAGPKEFLSLFKNAAFVCTNSFHGTVFSITFKKSFLTFTDKTNSKEEVNSRINNILGKLKLDSRIITAKTDINKFIDFLNSPQNTIDYSEVGYLLQKERQLSLEYLNNSIKVIK